MTKESMEKDLKIQSDEIIRLTAELKRVTKLKDALKSDNFKLIEALEEANKEVEEVVNALRLTHNKLYTLYHTKGALKRRNLDIDLIKAFFTSGNAIFPKYLINEGWDTRDRFNY